MEMERITIRLSEKDVATLDRLRGSADRSTFLRTLLRQAVRKPKAAKPSRDDALRMLAEHAEHDPRAAIHLEETLRGQEEVARLNAIAMGS